MFEIDNWGALCFSKSESVPSQGCKTTFPTFLRIARTS